jgi:hypothetical protein
MAHPPSGFFRPKVLPKPGTGPLLAMRRSRYAPKHSDFSSWLILAKNYVKNENILYPILAVLSIPLDFFA